MMFSNYNLGIVAVEAELTITSGLKWNADLLNRNSEFYKQLSSKIVAQVAFLFLLTFWNFGGKRLEGKRLIILSCLMYLNVNMFTYSVVYIMYQQ